jgi:hypothetical protein
MPLLCQVYELFVVAVQSVRLTRVNIFTAILMQISMFRILIFIDLFRNIEIYTYIKINSVDLPVTCKNLKYKKRVEYNNNLVCLYKNKLIDRFNFVKCISYQYAKE